MFKRNFLSWKKSWKKKEVGEKNPGWKYFFKRKPKRSHTRGREMKVAPATPQLRNTRISNRYDVLKATQSCGKRMGVRRKEGEEKFSWWFSFLPLESMYTSPDFPDELAIYKMQRVSFVLKTIPPKYKTAEGSTPLLCARSLIGALVTRIRQNST
ncbi:hypothetical protein AVEN_42205-1 [Araneus ventricosus]|uniref:Uncharacterized protein n=1 Tax=Araneus ventricosus TaxID=182803 RepID=A0A4Y2AXZ9_ARAVE|nr:hypothetical protein AVEN_42205-1 [Araneus ventricosus]